MSLSRETALIKVSGDFELTYKRGIILQQFHYFPIWIQENRVVAMRQRCKWTENVTILVHRSLCHLHTNYFRYCGVNFSSESSDNHQLLWNVKGNLLFTRIWKLLMIFLGKSVSIRVIQSPAPGAVWLQIFGAQYDVMTM